jgi:nucleoside-diphosphate-sugar epimerase
MKILITGAFGFVGTNLSAYLAARGHELIALYGTRTQPSAYTGFFTWDQLDRIDWAAIDAVIHLAGKAHDTRTASDPQSYFDVNVGLTQKIVDACIGQGRQGPKAFVLFSSVKAVADRVVGVLREDDLPAPQTPYGKSKLEAEKVVLSAFGSEPSVSRAYILRPCMIHGLGSKGNLNLMYEFVRRGIPWPLGAFENRRSFASIGNVCAAVEALLATHSVAAGVYQVADDEPLAINDVVRLIAESLGRESSIWRIPTSLVTAAARTGDLLRLPLDSERLKKLTESYVVSNEKLKQALGWQRMPVEARDGLRQTFASFAGER